MKEEANTGGRKKGEVVKSVFNGWREREKKKRVRWAHSPARGGGGRKKKKKTGKHHLLKPDICVKTKIICCQQNVQ